jgi:hypothetical protein
MQLFDPVVQGVFITVVNSVLETGVAAEVVRGADKLSWVTNNIAKILGNQRKVRKRVVKV